MSRSETIPRTAPSPTTATARVTLSDRPRALSVGMLSISMLFAITACAGGGATRALSADQRALIAGTVASVDLAPMAYDGDALVVVSTATHGRVTVHLPARRNLCKAQGFDLLTELRAGDAVQAEGTASGPSDLHLCLDARDALRRVL